MNIDIAGKVVIITGAGRGIGRETAELCAAEGASVVLAARSKDELEEVAAACVAKGGKALVHACDLATPEAAGELVKAAVAAYGRVDVLVNNAGTNHIGSLVMTKEEEWRTLYELNVFAVMRLTQAALKQMIRAKSGRIINVASVSAKVGAPYNTAYASSKGAILGFTRSLAKEVAMLGVTVNAVCPWFVDTKLVRYGMGKRGQMTGVSAEEFLKKVAEDSPQKRVIEAREVAGMILYLMSPEARAVNGQSLNVCGGVAMD